MSYYRRRPDPKSFATVEITPVSILTVVIGIFVSFVIPVQLIEIYKSNQSLPPLYTVESQQELAEQQGRVAGVSTDVKDLPDAVSQLLSDEKALTIGGSALLLLGVACCTYILLTDSKKETKKAYSLDNL